jgi:hypothetical protein
VILADNARLAHGTCTFDPAVQQANQEHRTAEGVKTKQGGEGAKDHSLCNPHAKVFLLSAQPSPVA